MDSDLPEPPSSPPLLPISRTRKRQLEVDFSSDGPTFSSDPTDPAVDIERRKRQYKGTWWNHGSDQVAAPKSALSRNFDSGIYLPSESSEDSIPKSDIENEVHTYKSRRLTRLPEPVDPLDIVAEKIVNGVMEEVGDLVDMDGVSFTKLQDQIFSPLNSAIRPPRFNSQSSPDEEAFQSLEPELQIFLSNNSLSTLPPSIWSVHSLTVLSLRNNHLTEIPGSISKLVNLRELNLSNNNLRYLPWELLSLLGPGERLTKIFMGNNPLYKGVDLGEYLDGARMDWVFPKSADEFQASLEVVKANANKGSYASSWLLKLMESFWQIIQRKGEASPIWEPLTHRKFYIASSPVCHFHRDGSQIRRGHGLPSPPPSVQPPALSEFSILPPSPLSSGDSGPTPLPFAPSLLELAIQACAAHKSVRITDMIPLLHYDTPEPVFRALRIAEQAKSEGGRVCSVCKRSYVIPRAEWLEFWHWVPENPKAINEEEMFWPFLRRGCSEACVP